MKTEAEKEGLARRMRELEEDMKRMEEVKGVWRMKERAEEEEKEEIEGMQDNPLRLTLIAKLEKLQD